MSILPNAKEKAFMKAVMDFHNEHGCAYLYGFEWHNHALQCHHVAGRSYKHNKIKIGHWFILPVPFDLHDVSSNSTLNVTHFRHRFTDKFGFQRCLWAKMVERLIRCEVIKWDDVPDSVYDAIMASKF